MEALTIEELKQMAGEPVWCPDEEAYGIVICDNKGRYNDSIPARCMVSRRDRY